MFPSTSIAATRGYFAVFCGVVFASCAAGAGPMGSSVVHSDGAPDAGNATDAAEESDGNALLDAASAVDIGAKVAVAPEDLGVPVGACLPRKTSDVPILKTGPTQVGFPTELVELFVRRGARVAVDECVSAARERESKLQGKVVLHFELPKTGGITGAAVSRGVGDNMLHGCIIGAFEKSPMPVLRDGGKSILDNFPVVICPDGHTEWPHAGGFH